MRAYIMFKVSPQQTIEVYNALKNEAHVTEAAVVHGPYDCVALVEGAQLEEINDVVMRMRQVGGVEDTMTSLVMQSYRRTGK